jgi:hypothetical protein
MRNRMHSPNIKIEQNLTKIIIMSCRIIITINSCVYRIETVHITILLSPACREQHLGFETVDATALNVLNTSVLKSNMHLRVPRTRPSCLRVDIRIVPQ